MRKIENLSKLYCGFIKTRTNNGDLCKQYFTLLTADNMDTTLIIEKNVLSDDYTLYHDFTPIKTYRGKTLLKQCFSIKKQTILSILTIITSNDNF
jgi:hypothetical protein